MQTREGSLTCLNRQQICRRELVEPQGDVGDIDRTDVAQEESAEHSRSTQGGNKRRQAKARNQESIYRPKNSPNDGREDQRNPQTVCIKAKAQHHHNRRIPREYSNNREGNIDPTTDQHDKQTEREENLNQRASQKVKGCCDGEKDRVVQSDNERENDNRDDQEDLVGRTPELQALSFLNRRDVTHAASSS